MTEEVQAHELAEKGGKWLGAAREYLQWHVRGGDSCIWGSNEPLTLTVSQIEEMASVIAAAAINNN